MKSAIIIGAGIGGLALANLLAKAGLQVTVYEKNDQPGGRAGRLDLDGFRFDTGPSWYLMPEVFEHYYHLLGQDITRQLNLVRLNPGYRVSFQDGTKLTVQGDKAADRQMFESLEPGSGPSLDAYLKQAAQTYSLAQKYFLYNNFESVRSVLHAEVLGHAKSMASLGFRSIHGNAAKQFANHKLQQVLEYPAVFLGASPFNTPAIYSLMSHLDFTQGVFYPQGGLYEIIASLDSTGKALGVQYHYNAPVRAITTKNGRAIGVELDGRRATADIVISNADLHFTETQLLPPACQTYPEKYWRKRTAGPSAVLLYLGVRGRLDNLQHHNLFFAKDWQAGFADIFERKRWPEPASMYVCAASKTDPNVAPTGCENLFVLVPGPAVATLSSSELERLADSYIAQLAVEIAVPDLAERIMVKRVFGPADFSERFNAWEGTALGLAHTLKQSAMFRPRNKSRKVEQLYYVGSSTVPGIGLPMCLISAELVYKRIIGDKSSGPLQGIAKL